MRKMILAAVALVGFVLPAFAFASDGSPQRTTTTTSAPATSAIAIDGSPKSSHTNRR